jgi:methyl halide transferase
MANVDRDWEQRYRDGETRWDSGLPSRELARMLDEWTIPPGRAIELGCGSGTNAAFLATQGFQVTGVDCSPTALRLADQKARSAGVSVDWIEADVQHFGAGLAPFDLVFDRGCYHCCRKVDLEGYLETLCNVTRGGSRFICLTGNADDPNPDGPPRVTPSEICDELSPLFRILQLRAFHFEDAGGIQGPLGWSLVAERR